MKFRYKKFLLPEKSDFFGTSILKPIIPVEIFYKEKSVKYSALIDSGADFCIFDAEIGEYLGIDIKSGEKERFGGIQERQPSTAFIHKLVLNIGGWNYQTTIGFSYEIARHGFGILGQRGFFNLFKVGFDLAKEEIELKENLAKKRQV